MELWLKCEVSEGQFSIEFAVAARQASGQGFSLFVPREYVVTDKEPGGGEMVPGWIKVELLEKGADRAVVLLPREPFEWSRGVTVRLDQLSRSPGEMVAP